MDDAPSDDTDRELITYLQKTDVAALVDSALAVVGRERAPNPLRSMYRALHAMVRDAALALNRATPGGFDLREPAHHALATRTADGLLELYPDEPLLALLEDEVCGRASAARLHSVAFLIAVKLARSKLLVARQPAHKVSVVVPLHADAGVAATGAEASHGQDCVRRRHDQLAWLYADRPDCTWELVLAECRYPNGCGDLVKDIVLRSKLRNATVVRGEPNVGGPTADAAPPKAAALACGLAAACGGAGGERPHVVVVAEAGLNADVGQVGLLTEEILRGRSLCAAGAPAGVPRAVACQAQQSDGWGSAVGADRDAAVCRSVEMAFARRLLPALAAAGVPEATSPLLAARADVAAEAAREAAGGGSGAFHGLHAAEFLLRAAVAAGGRCGAGEAAAVAVAVAVSTSVQELEAARDARSSATKRSFAALRALVSLQAKLKAEEEEEEGGAAVGAEGGPSHEREWTAFIVGLEFDGYKNLLDGLRQALAGKKDVPLPEPTALRLQLDVARMLSEGKSPVGLVRVYEA